jgi:hypothetical protein
MARKIFTLSIDLGNDMMQRPEDVAAALDELADELRAREGLWRTSSARKRDTGRIRDPNGNYVGDWQYIEGKG